MRRRALTAVITALIAATPSPALAKSPNGARATGLQAPGKTLPPWLRKTPRLIRGQWWVHSRYVWCVKDVRDEETWEIIGYRKCKGWVVGGRYRRG